MIFTESIQNTQHGLLFLSFLRRLSLLYALWLQLHMISFLLIKNEKFYSKKILYLPSFPLDPSFKNHEHFLIQVKAQLSREFYLSVTQT